VYNLAARLAYLGGISASVDSLHQICASMNRYGLGHLVACLPRVHQCHTSLVVLPRVGRLWRRESRPPAQVYRGRHWHQPMAWVVIQWWVRATTLPMGEIERPPAQVDRSWVEERFVVVVELLAQADAGELFWRLEEAHGGSVEGGELVLLGSDRQTSRRRVD
jgi:hypothetical protein